MSSVAALVPSRATQERRRAAWRAAFTEERRREIADRLGRLGPKHHFAGRAFAPFLERITGEGEPVDVQGLRAGPLADLLRTRIAEDAHGALVLTIVRSKGPGSWADKLESETGALVGSRASFARSLVEVVQRRLWTCGALGLGVMLVVLVPALASVRRVGAAALALVVGLAWSLGALALAGVAINAVNFLIPVLVLGLAVDYAIFLASGYAPGAGEREAQGAVVASGVTTLAGMASLLVAKHPAVYSVGVVSLVGTLASLAAVFLVIPALLARRDAKV
jgi:predicted exporter